MVETSTSGRLVLLRDDRLPDAAGVCCWRHGVREAFTAAGAARVDEIRYVPPTTTGRPGGPPGAGRLARLPAPLRVPLAAALFRVRHARDRRTKRRSEAARHNRAALAGLSGAALVIAESLEAGLAAVEAGVPRQRVWALALPETRLETGERIDFGGEVHRASKLLGGLLTDSEPARDSLERAASGRPSVEIFPPIAADRPCPAAHGDPAGPAGAPHPAAELLRRWRRLIDERQTAGRFPDPTGNWSSWGTPVAPPADPEPVPAADWTAAAQLATARRLWHTTSPAALATPRPRRSVLVTGFDLKFARELAERLDDRPDLRVTIDEWPHYLRWSRQTEQSLQQADSIFAEWARHNAVLAARRKRPDQFLVVRLHRYELDAPYPAQIAIENVDAVVYIAPLFGRRIRDELGWPDQKLVYIPNYLNLDWFDRPKPLAARFTLGLVGIEWSRKRFDLALELLARIRRVDPRFTLVVRSAKPWRNRFAWARADERAYTSACFARIERDPLLRGAVTVHPPGPDMARWFRQVGHILSTSDAEGCHTSVAEGMASGAVPVVRPWPGAAEVYDPRWVHDDLDAAAEAVLANADPERWRAQADAAKAEIRRSHDPAAVVAAWADLLHRDIQAARQHFAEFATKPANPPTPAPRRPAGSAPRPQRAADVA
ncbi:MAG TPA: glycosyltransferase [Natronosporangium sp.]